MSVWLGRILDVWDFAGRFDDCLCATCLSELWAEFNVGQFMGKLDGVIGGR